MRVVLNMQETITQLRQVRFSSGSGYDSRKAMEPTKAMDICGKFMELGQVNTRKNKDGSDLQVADLTLADDSGLTSKLQCGPKRRMTNSKTST